MNNSYANADSETIRQAQREWRIAKRREIEAKARKKAYKRAPSANGAGTPHLSTAVATAAFVNVSGTIATTTGHPVHATQAQLLQHSTTDPTAANAVHAATAAAHAASAAQAASEAAAVHSAAIQNAVGAFSQGQAALSQAIPLSQALSHNLDPATAADAANAAAAAFHAHLNSNSKRTRISMEEPGTDEEAAAAAAAAAMAHATAAANHGDAQFAPPVSIAAAPTPAASGTQTAVANVAPALEPKDDAQRQLLEQLEAQRRWREAKRREIALKKAKGAGSKRGRKKMRRDPPVSAAMPQATEGVIGAQPMSTQGTMVSHMAVTYVPSGHHPVVVGIPPQPHGVVKAEDGHVGEDPTTIYVQSAAGSVPGQADDGAAHGEQPGDMHMGEAQTDESAALSCGMMVQPSNPSTSGTFTGAELGGEARGERTGTTLQERAVASDGQDKGTGGESTARSMRVSHDDALRASVEIALQSGKGNANDAATQEESQTPGGPDVANAKDVTGAEAEAGVIGSAGAEAEQSAEKGDLIADTIANATIRATAEAIDNRAADGEDPTDPGTLATSTADGSRDAVPAGQSTGHEMQEDEAGNDALGEERVGPAAGSTASEDLQESHAVNADQVRKQDEATLARNVQQADELKTQHETSNTIEGKADDGQDTFPVDGGVDLMAASAWTSLDSIGNT